MRLTRTLLCLVGLDAVLEGVDAAAFNYGTDKIRRVIPGGWLVLESFITPGIFNQTGDFPLSMSISTEKNMARQSLPVTEV